MEAFIGITALLFLLGLMGWDVITRHKKDIEFQQKRSEWLDSQITFNRSIVSSLVLIEGDDDEQIDK